MRIVYGKQLNSEESKLVRDIALNCGIMYDTAKLLFYRNVDTVEKAKHFLNPGKSGFNNPFLLSGVREAVERLTLARDKNERVVIFGDYDADGVCATTVLYHELSDFGIKNIRLRVPERDEGYGLNVDTIKSLYDAEPIDLLLTVDCGISDYEKVDELQKMGIEVIVTDHHEPPETLPDCIRINPKLKDQDYPFNGLCGAGVAFKLGTALIGEKAEEYLDFVALATVADSMDLIDENRDIVTEGLKLFNNRAKLRLPFKYLLADNNKQVTAQTLAYSIAPRINAGGRMGDAKCALTAFTSHNPNEIFDLSVKLNEYNLERQVECDNIYNEAKIKIKKHSLNKSDIILVKDSNWRAGFIGIVAARLVEEYSRPVIVFAGHEDYLKGSARSVDGINIFEAISSAKDLLIGYGGHSQAAGVSVTEENFLALCEALNNYVREQYGKVDTTTKVYAEWNVDSPFALDFAREIDRLEPFGVGNRRPMFTVIENSVKAIPLRQNSPHYSMRTKALEMLDFNGKEDVLPLLLPMKKTLLFEVNLSKFRNRESIKGYLRGVYPDYDDIGAIEPYIFEKHLSALTEDGKKEYKTISKDQVTRDPEENTLFVVNDYKTLNRYESLKKLPVNLFEVKGSLVDSVIMGMEKIPEGYSRVIYLDKPMIVSDSNSETYVVDQYNGYKIIDKISTERSDFAREFNNLLALRNKGIDTVAEFAERYADEDDVYMFIFALMVFMELKIFENKHGVLTYNEKVKNALTNSEIYSKIVKLKV